MRLLNCPKKEKLFEFVSIPTEISRWKRAGIRVHSVSCAPCREQISTLRAQWDAYFTPEPDITSSLMNVYSRLQNDETLILKGWKLCEARPHRRLGKSHSLMQKSWLFGGGFSLALASLFAFVTLTGVKLGKPTIATADASHVWENANAPLAQIRFEDKNRVKVQYVQPELLQSIEFETSAR